MGIEPTTRHWQVTDFEDQGSHQTSFTSEWNCGNYKPWAAKNGGGLRFLRRAGLVSRAKDRRRPQRRGNRVISLGSGVGESSCPGVNGKVRVL